MKKFWIDFSGYVCVEAENAEQAEQKMFDAIDRTLVFPTDFSDDVWEIDCIDESIDEEDCPLGTVYSEKDLDIMKALTTGHIPSEDEWRAFWNEE